MNERLILIQSTNFGSHCTRINNERISRKAELSRQMISNYESGKTIPKADSILNYFVLQFPRSFSADTFELYSGATF